MGKVKEVFALIVEADVAGGAAAIRSFSSEAKKGLGDAEKAADSFAATSVEIGTKMAASGAAGLAALTALALSAKGAAGDVIGLQKVTGGSAEEMSVLRYAAQQTGVGLDKLTGGLVKLSKTAASDKGADLLAEYGIAARDAEGNLRPVQTLLSEVSDVVAGMANGTEKNDLVTSLFGKSGTGLLSLLSKGSEGMAEFQAEAEKVGAVMGGDTIDAAKRYTAAQRDVVGAVDALKTSIGGDALPFLAAVNEKAAQAATGLASAYDGLPENLRETAVAAGVVGSGTLSAAGGLIAFLGSAGAAAEGASTLKGKLSGLDGKTAALQLGLVTVAVAGFTYALSENAKQKQETLDLYVTDSDDLLAGIGRGDRGARNRASNIIAEKIDIGPQNAAGVIKQALGFWGEDDESRGRADAAKLEMEQLSIAISQLDAAAARTELGEFEKMLMAAGLSAGEAKSKLAPLYEQIGDDAAIDEATKAISGYADAVEGASAKAVTLAEAVAGLADGIDPGELTVYNETLQRGANLYLDVESANKKVEAAQRKYASSTAQDTDSIKRSYEGVEGAYKRLGDAKQALDDILAGDGNNLEQETPEAQLARARAQVLAANSALNANPDDADARTRKDEGLAAEQRAIDRRQAMKRDAVDQGRRVRDANDRIAEAEEGIKKAQEGLRDAQAANLSDIDTAKTDLIRAGVDVITAKNALVEGLMNGSADVDAISTQLQQLVDDGILPQSVLDEFHGDMDTMNVQALTTAGALQVLADSSATATTELAGAVDGLRKMSTFTLAAKVQESVLSSVAGVLGPNGEQYLGYDTYNNSQRGDLGADRARYRERSRGAGGPGNAGQMYRVNDPGPEYFVPNVDGKFVNAGAARTQAQNSQSVSESHTWNINGARSPEATAQQILLTQRGARFRRGQIRTPR